MPVLIGILCSPSFLAHKWFILAPSLLFLFMHYKSRSVCADVASSLIRGKDCVTCRVFQRLWGFTPLSIIDLSFFPLSPFLCTHAVTTRASFFFIANISPPHSLIFLPHVIQGPASHQQQLHLQPSPINIFSLLFKAFSSAVTNPNFFKSLECNPLHHRTQCR